MGWRVPVRERRGCGEREQLEARRVGGLGGSSRVMRLYMQGVSAGAGEARLWAGLVVCKREGCGERAVVGEAMGTGWCFISCRALR